MAQTTTIIVGFCLVGVVTWAVLYWCTERFLRVFLALSVALHVVLFVIPFAVGKSAPAEAVGPRLIPYTIVQGADEPTIDLGDIDMPEEAEDIDDVPATEVVGEDAIVVQAAREERVPAGVVHADLPKIDDTTWFAFEEHPGAASYRKELQRTIQRHFEVPEAIEARGYEGRLKVWFTLGRDGRLLYSFLDPTMCSEDDEINRLTEENLKRIADKFPPFPEGVKDYDVRFYVLIDYRNLRNR